MSLFALFTVLYLVVGGIIGMNIEVYYDPSFMTFTQGQRFLIGATVLPMGMLFHWMATPLGVAEAVRIVLHTAGKISPKTSFALRTVTYGLFFSAAMASVLAAPFAIAFIR